MPWRLQANGALRTGSRASQDESREMHTADDETVVDAEQGNGMVFFIQKVRRR